MSIIDQLAQVQQELALEMQELADLEEKNFTYAQRITEAENQRFIDTAIHVEDIEAELMAEHRFVAVATNLESDNDYAYDDSDSSFSVSPIDYDMPDLEEISLSKTPNSKILENGLEECEDCTQAIANGKEVCEKCKSSKFPYPFSVIPPVVWTVISTWEKLLCTYCKAGDNFVFNGQLDVKIAELVAKDILNESDIAKLSALKYYRDKNNQEIVNGNTPNENELLIAFCESCRIKVAAAPGNECTTDSPKCLKTRWMNELGGLSLMCKGCHQYKKSQQKNMRSPRCKNKKKKLKNDSIKLHKHHSDIPNVSLDKLMSRVKNGAPKEERVMSSAILILDSNTKTFM